MFGRESEGKEIAFGKTGKPEVNACKEKESTIINHFSKRIPSEFRSFTVLPFSFQAYAPFPLHSPIISSRKIPFQR